MLRKLSVLMVAVLLQDPFVQSVAAIASVTLFMCLQLSYQPYQAKTFNRLETLALVALFVTQVVSVAYLRESAAVDEGDEARLSGLEHALADETTATAVLLLINIATVLVFAAALVWALLKRHASKHASVRARITADRVAKTNPFAAEARLARLRAATASGSAQGRLSGMADRVLGSIAARGSGKRLGSGRGRKAFFAAGGGGGSGRTRSRSGSDRSRARSRSGSGRRIEELAGSNRSLDLSPITFSENPMFVAAHQRASHGGSVHRPPPLAPPPPPSQPPPPLVKPPAPPPTHPPPTGAPPPAAAAAAAGRATHATTGERDSPRATSLGNVRRQRLRSRSIPAAGCDGSRGARNAPSTGRRFNAAGSTRPLTTPPTQDNGGHAGGGNKESMLWSGYSGDGDEVEASFTFDDDTFA